MFLYLYYLELKSGEDLFLLLYMDPLLVRIIISVRLKAAEFFYKNYTFLIHQYDSQQ
jgi:hypothetical protein